MGGGAENWSPSGLANRVSRLVQINSHFVGAGGGDSAMNCSLASFMGLLWWIYAVGVALGAPTCTQMQGDGDRRLPSPSLAFDQLSDAIKALEDKTAYLLDLPAVPSSLPKMTDSLWMALEDFYQKLFIVRVYSLVGIGGSTAQLLGQWADLKRRLKLKGMFKGNLGHAQAFLHMAIGEPGLPRVVTGLSHNLHSEQAAQLLHVMSHLVARITGAWSRLKELIYISNELGPFYTSFKPLTDKHLTSVKDALLLCVDRRQEYLAARRQAQLDLNTLTILDAALRDLDECFPGWSPRMVDDTISNIARWEPYDADDIQGPLREVFQLNRQVPVLRGSLRTTSLVNRRSPFNLGSSPGERLCALWNSPHRAPLLEAIAHLGACGQISPPEDLTDFTSVFLWSGHLLEKLLDKPKRIFDSLVRSAPGFDLNAFNKLPWLVYDPQMSGLSKYFLLDTIDGQHRLLEIFERDLTVLESAIAPVKRANAVGMLFGLRGRGILLRDVYLRLSYIGARLQRWEKDLGNQMDIRHEEPPPVEVPDCHEVRFARVRERYLQVAGEIERMPLWDAFSSLPRRLPLWSPDNR